MCVCVWVCVVLCVCVCVCVCVVVVVVVVVVAENELPRWLTLTCLFHILCVSLTFNSPLFFLLPKI